MSRGMEACWLIEWPASRQDVVRYWHPTEGRVIDPHHAIRFCRKEDADAVCKRWQLHAGARPVEHIFGLHIRNDGGKSLPWPPTGALADLLARFVAAIEPDTTNDQREQLIQQALVNIAALSEGEG